MLNEISKTDAGFKKGGMNFTLVFEAWAHNTRNSFSGGQNDEVLTLGSPSTLQFTFLIYPINSLFAVLNFE